MTPDKLTQNDRFGNDNTCALRVAVTKKKKKKRRKKEKKEKLDAHKSFVLIVSRASVSGLIFNVWLKSKRTPKTAGVIGFR